MVAMPGCGQPPATDPSAETASGKEPEPPTRRIRAAAVAGPVDRRDFCFAQSQRAHCHGLICFSAHRPPVNAFPHAHYHRARVAVVAGFVGVDDLGCFVDLAEYAPVPGVWPANGSCYVFQSTVAGFMELMEREPIFHIFLLHRFKKRASG